MQALSKFYPFTLPYVMGAPDAALDQAILSTCIDFCSRTLIVQSVSTYDLVAGVSEYEVDVESGARLVKILKVFTSGRLLKPTTVEDVKSAEALTTGASGAPQTYFTMTPNEAGFVLYPTPDAVVTGGLVVRAAVAPTRSATSVADVLFEDWADTIGAGAAARLLGLPRQPFTDPASAAALSQQYESAVLSASVESRIGQTVGASRVQPARFVI